MADLLVSVDENYMFRPPLENRLERNHKTYTDTAVKVAVNTSNLALDFDGTPYFNAGSMSLKISADTDGIPYFTEL